MWAIKVEIVMSLKSRGRVIVVNQIMHEVAFACIGSLCRVPCVQPLGTTNRLPLP